MIIVPLVLASLVHLSSAPAPCEEILSCGKFAGVGVQTYSNQSTDEIEEFFEITDASEDVVRIVERTRNLTTRVERVTTIELVFAPDRTFKLREIAGEPKVIGEGSCVAKTCTFKVYPDRAVAAGSFEFSEDELQYWIGEVGATTKTVIARRVRAKRLR